MEVEANPIRVINLSTMKNIKDSLDKLGRNRIWLAPLTNQQSHADGSASEEEINWLVARAKGGFGLVMTCASHVSKDGQVWPGQMGVFSDELLPGLKRLSNELREYNSVSIVQLFHGGRRSVKSVTGLEVISPSGLDGSKAMSESDIKRVILEFGEAAARSEEAGFDGVEIHGAHSYLISQFLSEDENKRTDDWGGSNRSRFLFEIIDEVRRRVSKEFIVGVRISPISYSRLTGIYFSNTIELLKKLDPAKIDFLDASLWNFKVADPENASAGSLIPQIRVNLNPMIPLVVAGMIVTKEDANEALSMGADAVALGKVAIGNADWPKRVLEQGLPPRLAPYSHKDLFDQSVSQKFIEYLKAYPDFIKT